MRPKITSNSLIGPEWEVWGENHLRKDQNFLLTNRWDYNSLMHCFTPNTIQAENLQPKHGLIHFSSVLKVCTLIIIWMADIMPRV